MGLGLDLTGVSKSRGDCAAEEFCQELCDWLSLNAADIFEGAHGPNCGHDHDHDHDHSHDHDGENCDDDEDECRAIVGNVLLFPSTEPLFVEAGPGGTLRLSTKTTILGPGYHRWLCGLLQELGREFEVEWKQFDEEGNPGDDTGFFFYGDSARVDYEMLNWLKSASGMLRDYMKQGYDGLGLNMPASPQFLDYGPMLTILGPRSAEWLETVIADPSKGTDVFPWWEDGQGALLLRNRALCRMWDAVSWRKPLDEDDVELLHAVHNDLERAYELDPTLSYPWHEWNEILTLLEQAEEDDLEEEGEEESEEAAGLDVDERLRATIREFASVKPGGERIGYRRGNLRTSIAGGWSIVIPGSLQETYDEEGNWGAVDDERQVWVSSLSLETQDGDTVPAVELLNGLAEDERMEIPFGKHDRIVGGANLTFEEDAETPHWQLTGRCAVDGQAAITTVLMLSESDHDWAIDVWRSLMHQTPEEE